MAIIPRWQTPISRWQLDGNANDLYGLYNGSNAGTVTYSTTSKEKGYSVYNAGSASNYVNVGNWKFTDYTNFTISGWIKYTGTTQCRILCNIKTGAIYPNLIFYGSGNFVGYYISDNSNNVTNLSSSNIGLNDGNWHHCVLIDANGSVSCYVDGKLTDLTGTYTRSSFNTDIVVISGQPTTPAYGSTGYVDDVRFYDVALTADEVMNLYKSYATPIWQQPLHHWKLDGNANDSAGDKNGTASNMTYSAAQKVIGNYSGYFNGSSSVINCGNWSFFSYTNISISLWFKVTGTNDAFLTCTRPGYDIPRVQFMLDSAGYLNYTIVNNSGSVLFSEGGPMCNDGVWHHICVTDANGTVSSYLDGSPTTPSGSYSRSNLSNLTTVNMGIMVLAANQRPFAGLMDDVRFYDVALSAADVRALYNSYFTEKATNFISSMV